MKKSKKFFCGLAAFFLALGAGHAALSLSQAGRRGAFAAVTDVEPVSELHLDQSKIKKVSAHYETMAGPTGSEITAYVFEGAGNLYDGSTFPEFRFMTEGSNGSTKIAYPSDVKYVHFWYKLNNANETQMIDVEAVPYLLQVVTSDGGYPGYGFTPVNDNAWHPWLMEVRSEDYARFAGVLVELGDLNGSIAIADLRLNQKITQDAPTGLLHLEPEKIKGYTEHHYELMPGPNGDEVNTYVFSAQGNTSKNPEVRFVTEGTQTVNKPYTYDPLPCALKVTFDYKLSTTAHKSVDDGTMEYLLQVLGSDGQYPLHDWQPVNDGQWHSWTMDVTKSLDVDGNRDYHDKFSGIVVKMGDINGSLTIANVAVKTAPDDVFLDDLVSFKSYTQSYFYISGQRNNITLMLDLGARVFANSSFDSDGSSETFINDHYPSMTNKEGVATNVQNAIIIAGKTLGEWMDMHIDMSETAESRWPLSEATLGDKYRPVTIRVCRNDTTSNQWLQIDVIMTYVSMMDFTVEFDASKFEIYNGETTYKFANNVKFYPTVPTDKEPSSNTITYVKQETRTSVTGSFINISNRVATDHNNGKSYRIDLYSNLSAKFTGDANTGYTNFWAVDHIQYIANAILINGVKASTFSAYAWRDGLHTVGSEVDAGSPANDNFAWPVLVQFIDTNTQSADDNRIHICIDINKAALGRYTNSATLNTITIADDFTFIRDDGVLCKLAEDVELGFDAEHNYVYDRSTEVVFKPVGAYFDYMQFTPEEPRIPMIVVRSNERMGWGFNISDKAAYQFNLQKVFINGKSIAQINEDFGPNISLEEYKLGDFDIYGLDGSGIPNPSPLTKPVITNAPAVQNLDDNAGYYVFYIFLHPKYFATLSPIAGLNVKFAEGFRVVSDDGILYSLAEETTVVAQEKSLKDSTAAQLGENDLINNIGLWRPDHQKNAVKGFDQDADHLVYKEDANGHTGIYFTSGNAAEHGEFRVYMPGNGYKTESKGYAMTRLTFDYILFDSGVATETGRNHSISSTGEYIESVGTATNKFTVQALLHDASNMYYDIDVELVNDGQLHTCTIDLAYGDVMGFCFVLWNFCGEFFMSNCVADYLPYSEGLNTFVYSTLKMFEVTDNETGWEANVEGAIAAFDGLSADEQNLFNTHAAYASARARFNNWKSLKAAADLAAYKVAKVAYVDEYVAQIIGNYREAEQQLINGGAAQAKQAINAASSIAEIDAIIANMLDQLATLKTDEQYKAEELAAAKTAAKSELEAYKKAADYRQAEQQQMATIIAQGNAAIDAATDQAGVASALAAAKEQLDALKTAAEYEAEELAEAKALAKAELDAYKNADAYREAQKAELAAAIAAGKEAIDAATTKDGVAAALAAAKEAIDAIKTDAEMTAAELAEAKALAKAELEAYKNPSDYREAEQQEMARIIAAGKEAIDAATDKAGVAAALAEAKQQLDALKTAAQYDAEELAAYKEKAITALTNYYNTLLETNKYDEAGKAALKAAFDEAIAAINAATDKAGVNAAVTAGQAALEAVEQYVEPTSESEPGETSESEPVTPSDSSSEQQPAKKGGCGGSIAATSIILSMLAVAGVAVMASKKRKED